MKQEKEYYPSTGVKKLLQELHRATTYGGDSISCVIRDLEKSKSNLVQARQAVKEAEDNLKLWETKLRSSQHTAAELIIDLTKLGCPEHLIKAEWPEYNNHDIAEWIQY